MGFKSKAAIYGKVAIPQAVRKEIEIAHKVEKYKMPNTDRVYCRFTIYPSSNTVWQCRHCPFE